LRASNYFDSKGFIKTPSAVASSDGEMHITSSCDGTVGSEFVIIDDFKISAGGGESQGSSSSIYIGSTESAKQKVGTLSKEFTITVEPSLAITTTDISTPENADKVINLTANKGGADFFIAGGADENKFSLKVGTLVIGKNDLAIDKDGIVDLDIGRGFIV
jgi:hypothetical protein